MDQIQSIGQLLLDEFRQFRKDITEWRQETGERLATLEATSKSGITGNGQPSRLTVVEDRLRDLERFRWWVVGAGAAVWGSAEVLIHMLVRR